jgi:hypothetical protein
MEKITIFFVILIPFLYLCRVIKKSTTMAARNFTLRLNDDESAALAKLRELTGKATDAAVIKHVLKEFQYFFDWAHDAAAQNRELSKVNAKMKSDIEAYINSLQSLKNYID